MKYYKKLLEMGCFTRDEVIELTGNSSAANSLIYDYLNKGYIQRVKHNLYVTISLEDDCPVYNRYQIGSKLFDDAYITHHSAFEVYGIYNQVYYDCYIATKHKFNDFEFDGIYYRRVDPSNNNHVETKNRIRYSSLEKTIIDCIKDCNKISDVEELVKCILMVNNLDETKMIEILGEYDNKFLYQKCGYIFDSLKEHIQLSEHFFDVCKSNIAKTKRYFDKDVKCDTFNKKWNLYVPKYFSEYYDKGVDLNAVG